VTAEPQTVALAHAVATAAEDKLAQDVVAFDVSEQIGIADVFLLCSGASDRQVRAVVDAVEKALHEQVGRPLRREGEREARWVLLDYGDLVVHVMQTDDRQYYALERLWKDCPVVNLDTTESDGAGERSR
jgi:ribosome-associated protein